jgi:hypothetical protein
MAAGDPCIPREKSFNWGREKDSPSGGDPMMTGLVLLVLAAPAPAPRPGVVSLLERDEKYRKAAAAEVTLEGLVEQTPSGRVEASRYNAFRLRHLDRAGREVVRELHVPGKAHLLSGHAGKKVRIRGKLIDTREGGKTYRELWPAWLEPLTEALANRPGADGVLARCTWRPEEARARGMRQYVFRSGEELARAMRVSGPSAAETATILLAQRLGLPTIDWNKHMLVCVSAGLQGPGVEGLVIVRAAGQGGVLRISYRLVRARGGGLGFGYPAQAALVARSGAKVRFEQELAPTKE